ncbi:MAG: AarF/ABC1/UbiB kinase family protein, partial [Pseudobdellovibrio sp.]
GLGAGIKYASTKITNGNLDEFINSQAINLTKEFGELKGSVMKAGQMLSMYGEHFLPAEANKILKTLQSDSPAIAWPVMQKHLNEYLDEELIAELEINPDSIGSASMGQVHSAVIRATGEKIALKIQYPDVDLAIDSDVAALKKILSLSKILPKGLDLSQVFEEIKTMLRQELDYTLEAQQTIAYGKLVENDERFVVPKVYSRYSNSKVLATEYVDGLKADHVLVQNISQERRNRLSENFIELYFKEIFEWNLVQTDPHLGNYKIQLDPNGRSNDRLVLLDFGATKKFNEVFITHYRKMIKGSIQKDEPLFFEGARGLGFVISSDSAEYIETFKNFCYETVEPFAPEGSYQWKANDLPNRVIKKAIQFKNFDLRSPPRDILFLDRKTGGVFIFLSVLGALINARKIIDPYLNKV